LLSIVVEQNALHSVKQLFVIDPLPDCVE
jgi:hypothetical protein